MSDMENRIERNKRVVVLDYNILSESLKKDLEEKAKELNISPEEVFNKLYSE